MEGGETEGKVRKNAAAGSVRRRMEVPEADPSPESTFGKLLQLMRAMQTGMQNIDSGLGLSGSQLWALWLISAQPGLRVSELAREMYIRHSTASNLLDKLEARTLVRRERRNQDNRVVQLDLTSQGMALVAKISGPMQGRLRHGLRAIPAPILCGLSAGINALLEVMAEERE